MFLDEEQMEQIRKDGVRDMRREFGEKKHIDRYPKAKPFLIMTKRQYVIWKKTERIDYADDI